MFWHYIYNPRSIIIEWKKKLDKTKNKRKKKKESHPRANTKPATPSFLLW